MDTKRPSVVTIAAILLLVLGLFVAGLGIANQFGLGGANRAFVAGQFRNRNFNPQGGGQFNNNPIGALPNDGQTNQGATPNFNRNFTGGTRTGITGFLRVFRFVSLGLDIAILILAVVAAFGLIKGKRWGQILAIVIAAITLLLTIPNFIRIFSAIVLTENIIRILLAAAVIILLLLPTSRKTIATATVSDQEPAERIVR
jgi:hypothetical protein